MAYKLGQLTKIEGADYVQTIKCSAGTFSTKFFAQDMLNDIVFLDESIYPESSLVASETYYLSFKHLIFPSFVTPIQLGHPLHSNVSKPSSSINGQSIGLSNS